MKRFTLLFLALCLAVASTARADFLTMAGCWISGTTTSCAKPVAVASGGTGAASLTTNSLVLAQGTNALTVVAADTTTTDVLHGGTPPTFGAVAAADLPTATQSAKGATTSFFPTVQSAVKTATNADYIILDGDGYSTVLVSTGGSNRTITLPAVANNAGRIVTIKKTDNGAGTVIIAMNGGTIDGSTGTTLSSQYGFIRLVCDGSNWFSIAVFDRVLSESQGSGSTFTNTIGNLAAVSIFAGHWHCYGGADYAGSAGNNSFFGCFKASSTSSCSGTNNGSSFNQGALVGAVGGISLSDAFNVTSTTVIDFNVQTLTGSAGVGGILGSIICDRVL